MLGFHSLSEAPISALADNINFGAGSAIGVANVLGVSIAKSYAVGTALGVATVTSLNQHYSYLPVLRGMNRQPVNSTAEMSDDPVSILGTF